MGNTFYFDFEVKFMEFLQRFANPFFKGLATAITFLGEETVIIAILGFFYWCYDKKLGKFIGTNAIFTLLTGSFFKNIFIRRRPYMDNKTIKCLRPVDKSADINDLNAQGFSMPSMHAANSITIYGSASIKFRKRALTVIFGVIVFLIGLSRVFLGVHYPTDILAAWTVGIIGISVSGFLQKKIKNRLIYMAILAVLFLPGWFFATSNDFFAAYGLLIGIFSAFHFEEKFVDFDIPKSILKKIIRIVAGVAVFLAINSLIKLPFSEAFLASDCFFAHFIRTARYCIASFAALGIYPLCFKYIEKY